MQIIICYIATLCPTEEAKEYFEMARIKPQDIISKTFDDFKEDANNEEIAKIRYDHYQ